MKLRSVIPLGIIFCVVIYFLYGFVASFYIGGLSAWFYFSLVRRRRYQRRAEFRSCLVGWVEGLSSDIKAGIAPLDAFNTQIVLLSSSTNHEEQRLFSLLQPIQDSANCGNSLADLLSEIRLYAARDIFNCVCTVWSISEKTGVPLSTLLYHIVDNNATNLAFERESTTRIAGIRASVHILTVLPLVTIIAGWVLDLSVWGILIHTRIGLYCLIIGTLFQVVGILWSTAIINYAGYSKSGS